jgi:hypothetical protein
MQERGVFVDHATVHRWAMKILPVLAAVFRHRKRPVGASWRMDETYIKVAGEWKYLYRAVDLMAKRSTSCFAPRETALLLGDSWSEPSDCTTCLRGSPSTRAAPIRLPSRASRTIRVRTLSCGRENFSRMYLTRGAVFTLASMKVLFVWRLVSPRSDEASVLLLCQAEPGPFLVAHDLQAVVAGRTGLVTAAA